MTLTDVLDFGTKKGFTPRNKHVKYESSITNHSKATATVKVFCKQTNMTMNTDLELVTNRKVLLQ